MVSAIRVVKAYVREDHEASTFKKASGNIYKLLVKAENVVVFTLLPCSLRYIPVFL